MGQGAVSSHASGHVATSCPRGHAPECSPGRGCIGSAPHLNHWNITYLLTTDFEGSTDQVSEDPEGTPWPRPHTHAHNHLTYAPALHTGAPASVHQPAAPRMLSVA